MIKESEFTGKKFGRLTVLQKKGTNNHKKSIWLCRCDCGTELIVIGSSLKNGNTKSCGCLHEEVVTTHGKTQTSEHQIWRDILQRCSNPNNRFYQDYGGRGISTCERWHSFENFYEDMGPRPSTKHSIDRIENNGNYEPRNCKWATKTEQAWNQRKNRKHSSGRRGVGWDNTNKKWIAYITVNQKRINLGRFTDLSEAISVRQHAEKTYWGKSS